MSDRYKFLKDYKDPLNVNKTFLAGSTARLDDATGAALVANGTVMRVADYTPQRKDALAPGGCTELPPSAKAALATPTPTHDKEGTELKITNKKN